MNQHDPTHTDFSEHLLDCWQQLVETQRRVAQLERENARLRSLRDLAPALLVALGLVISLVLLAVA
jgi:hypothetical protein